MAALHAASCKVACYTVAKSVTEQAVREQPQQGELVGLVNMLVDDMAVQDTKVGSDIEVLRPTAGHAAGGVYDDEQWPSKVFPEGADTFDPDVVSQAVDTIINAGPSGGGGGKAVPSAGGKGKEGPGIDAGPSKGSEGDGGGGGPLPDKIPLPGLGDKEPHSDEEAAWEGGSEDFIESASEDGAPLPYQIVAEFVFTTEKTAQFIGLRCLGGTELFIPTLRLNLEQTNQHIFQ